MYVYFVTLYDIVYCLYVYTHYHYITAMYAAVHMYTQHVVITYYIPLIPHFIVYIRYGKGPSCVYRWGTGIATWDGLYTL